MGYPQYDTLNAMRFLPRKNNIDFVVRTGSFVRSGLSILSTENDGLRTDRRQGVLVHFRLQMSRRRRKINCRCLDVAVSHHFADGKDIRTTLEH